MCAIYPSLLLFHGATTHEFGPTVQFIGQEREGGEGGEGEIEG